MFTGSRQLVVVVAGATIAVAMAVLFMIWGPLTRTTTPDPVATPSAPSAPATPPVVQAPTPTPPASQPAPTPAAPTPPAAQPPGPLASAPPAPVPPAAPAAPVAPPAAAPPPAAPRAEAADRPSFDVVRVEPDGSTVVAGRAPPGAKVRLLAGTRELANAVADPSGAFVMIPPPLPKGSHTLSLVIGDTPARAKTSPEQVIVELGQGAPLIIAQAPGQPTRILQEPSVPPVAATTPQPQPRPATAPSATPTPAPASPASPASPAAPAPPATATAPLRFRVVEADARGQMFVGGLAAPGATLRIYLNNAYVAEAVAAPSGEWSLTVQKGLPPGRYAVRTDQVDPATGRVSARAEVAFDFEPKVAAVSPPSPASPAPARPATPELAGQPEPIPAPGASPAPVPATSPTPNAATNPATDPSPATPPRAAPTAPAPQSGPVARDTSAPKAPPAKAEQPARPQVATRPAGRPQPRSEVVVAAPETVVVQRGDSLWRIARETYGAGVRYTAIYGANRAQIRDPDLIYPGQIFVVPTKGDR